MCICLADLSPCTHPSSIHTRAFQWLQQPDFSTMHYSCLAMITKSGMYFSNAGGLSLPLKTKERGKEVVDPVNVFNMIQF